MGKPVKAKKPQLYGLNEERLWVVNGRYGLVDRPGGGWDWSGTPQYLLDITTKTWRRI